MTKPTLVRRVSAPAFLTTPRVTKPKRQWTCAQLPAQQTSFVTQKFNHNAKRLESEAPSRRPQTAQRTFA